MNEPLCFVLMPFGTKPDAAGTLINFDAVYQNLIKPAIEEAGLEPLRADEEMTGGIIHKPMFERLILCEFAVADLTVLAKDEQRAIAALSDSLPLVREVWEPETTARNLSLIREARELRHEDEPWQKQIEEALLERAKA